MTNLSRDAEAPTTYWGKDGPAGTWDVTGVTPQGDPYVGTLSLNLIDNVYLATWNSQDGDQFFGTGVIHDGYLYVARAPGNTIDDRASIVLVYPNP